MPLWARYQQCLVTTDPTELILIIDQFERAIFEPSLGLLRRSGQ